MNKRPLLNASLIVLAVLTILLLFLIVVVVPPDAVFTVLGWLIIALSIISLSLFLSIRRDEGR